MLNLQLIGGDPVAVLPFSDAPAERVLEISTVRIANNVFIQLSDGRIYASLDGRGLTPTSNGCIVPATDDHRRRLMAQYAGAAEA